MNMMTTIGRPVALAPAPVLRSLPSEQLARTIQRACREAGTSITRFGRDVGGDPRLVLDLLAGREMRPLTRAKVLAGLERMRAGSAVRA